MNQRGNNAVNECTQKRETIFCEWKKFVDTGNCDAAIIRPIILESWQRCRKLGLDPTSSKKNCFMDEPLVIHTHDSLLKIAAPYMDILAGLVAGTGFIGILTNNEGLIMQTVGDTDLLETANRQFMKPGAIRTETLSGTNAIGLCLLHKQPIQTFSAEHYNVFHHDWTCSSAPICDELGELVGVLNLSGDYRLIHKHTLGIVVSLAKALEREIRLNFTNTCIRNCIDYSEYGMVVLDNKLNVKHINKKLSQYFSISHDVLGRPMQEVFQTEPPFVKTLLRDNQLFEKSITIKGQKKETTLLVNSQTILSDDGERIGYLAVTKEKKDLHRLVHRIVGAYATFTFDNLLGNNKKFAAVKQLAQNVAATTARVLIQGESGTGKELFAQAIHNSSPLRDGPFIGINCSAIPSELLESELFGYDEGAFSGAKKGGMPGKFELAEGGTIFLDEIDSLPQEMQIKLLRVLEDNKIIRIGGNRVIPINVRIIAASGKNMEKLVMQGRMRLDLYYRINTIILDIPPLRERPDDIPVLAKHFVDMICNKLGLKPKKIAENYLARLTRYNWPGNIRELCNCIERSIIIAKDNAVLSLEHLSANYSLLKENIGKAEIGIDEDTPRIKTLKELEQQAIEDTLKLTKNNYILTAKLLGIHRNTLYNKLKEQKWH
jgi:transcriptional regulator with PAS, ATPase and Fis domain